MRGKGVVRGRKTMHPAIRAAVRAGVTRPYYVTHEMKHELRSLPGGQAVVTAIAERLLPQADHSGMLERDVNHITGIETAIPFNTIPGFTGATDDAVANITLCHRNDWTMFTNGAWRDGYGFINGKLGGAIGTVGYLTPYVTGVAAGAPSYWDEQLVLNQPGQAADGTVPVAPITVNPAGGTNASRTQLSNYHHVMEELSWTITNNSVANAHVTIYECILNRDVMLNDTVSEGSPITNAVEWAGMPCPLELWRQSREVQFEPNVVDGTIGAGGEDWRIPIAPTDANEGPGVTATGFNRDPTTAAYASGARVRDIDAPNVQPNRAALLHTWYKIIPHTRTLPPGATTTITVHVRFNKRIPGAWWNMLYGAKGMTRCFFMVNRMDAVVGIAGQSEGGNTRAARLPVMAPTDLVVRWTKKKCMARTQQRVRHSLFVRAAMPEIDDTVARNAVTGVARDADDVADGADEA